MSMNKNGIQMKLVSWFFSVVLMSATFSSSPLRAEPDFNDLGMRGYAHWKCAAMAMLVEDEQDLTEQLFQRGYDLLKVLVKGMSDGKILKEDVKEVPIGILWNLSGGPSVDFMLGSLWSRISDDTYDELFPKDIEGSFDEKKETQILTAKSKLRSENCASLRWEQ